LYIRQAGHWLFSHRRWLDPLNHADRAALDANFADLCCAFPPFAASCDATRFLESLLDISAAWNRLLQADGPGRRCRFITDYAGVSTITCPLWLLHPPQPHTGCSEPTPTEPPQSTPSGEERRGLGSGGGGGAQVAPFPPSAPHAAFALRPIPPGVDLDCSTLDSCALDADGGGADSAGPASSGSEPGAAGWNDRPRPPIHSAARTPQSFALGELPLAPGPRHGVTAGTSDASAFTAVRPPPPPPGQPPGGGAPRADGGGGGGERGPAVSVPSPPLRSAFRLVRPAPRPPR
jgi:hypothetical protein